MAKCHQHVVLSYGLVTKWSIQFCLWEDVYPGKWLYSNNNNGQWYCSVVVGFFVHFHKNVSLESQKLYLAFWLHLFICHINIPIVWTQNINVTHALAQNVPPSRIITHLEMYIFSNDGGWPPPNSMHFSWPLATTVFSNTHTLAA